MSPGETKAPFQPSHYTAEPFRLEPEAPHRSRTPIFIAAALLGVGAIAAGIWFLTSGLTLRKETPRQPLAPVAALPPEIQELVDKANQGDVKAMRQLGTYYFNGLYVPRNREEGIRWTRKAAEAGSLAAQEELRDIEAGRK